MVPESITQFTTEDHNSPAKKMKTEARGREFEPSIALFHWPFLSGRLPLLVIRTRYVAFLASRSPPFTAHSIEEKILDPL
jgi:hypothetical protein